MFNIKLLNKISKSGLGSLEPELFKVGEDVESPDGIILRSFSMHDWEVPASLKAVARAGAGVNNIPIEKCTELGIAVFNTPGANANAVKELTIMGLFMCARKVFPAMQWVQGLKGKGDEVPALVEKGKSNFAGPELAGKKLGVVGLGMIGVMVANTAVELGMEVYGYDPFLTVGAAFKANKNVSYTTSLREIYSQCDFITLHLPSLADTRGMINAEALSLMKPDVRILNFSRGDLVNNADMLAALDAGKAYCYLTDFPDDTLIGHPGVIAIPHLGASTPESEENCAIMAVNQMRDYLETGNVRNSINLPDMQVHKSGLPRLAIIHKNEPSVVSQISGIVGDNVGNITTDSRKATGYTILDLNAALDESLLKQIKALDGVICARYFD